MTFCKATLPTILVDEQTVNMFILDIQNNMAHSWKACSIPPESEIQKNCLSFKCFQMITEDRLEDEERIWESYLSGEHAEEDEDEHSLKGVCDREQIGGERRLVENMQHSEGPGGAEHKQ